MYNSRMFKFDSENNQYTFKGNNYFAILSAGTLFMAFSGIRLIFDILPFEYDYTGADVFGLIFVCFWTLLVFIGFIISINNATKRIIINSESVICKTLFFKETYLWSEIEDWGLSYCGGTRGEGNTYYFYFSKQQQRIKNECRKNLRGKMIKTFIFEGDYEAIIKEVIPFCSTRTFIKPFIGVDKHHWF